MSPGHEQLGSSAHQSEANDLMPELLAILDPQQLSEIYTSGDLHSKALTEQQYIDVLSSEARHLQDQLDMITIRTADSNARKSAYLEAYELARAIEDGK